MPNSLSDAARRFAPLPLFFCSTLLVVGRHTFPLTQISGLSYDRNDAILFLWNFWWTDRAIGALRDPYWSDLILHPAGGSLAFTSFPLPYGIISIPFQRIWPGIDGLAIAFNIAILFSFTVAAFGAYRLAQHVTRNVAASLVAGVIYGYSLFHTLNMARLHLVALEFIPFYVLSLLRLAEAPTLRRAIAPAVWLALCFYSSLEYALYLALLSAFWLVYQLVVGRGGQRWQLVRALIAAAACFVVLAAPLLYKQLEEISVASVRFDLEETSRWSPALLAFVTPSRVHPVYGDAMRFAGSYGEPGVRGMRSEASLGLVAIALAALGVWQYRRDRSAFFALSAAGFITLALGPYLRVTGTHLTEIPMPYLVLYDLFPPLRVGRDPTRLLAIATLMLAVLAAFGAREILKRVDAAWTRALVAVALCGGVLFESLPHGAKKLSIGIHPVYREISEEPGDFTVVDHSGRFANLLGQIVHGKRLTYVTAFPRAIPAGVDWNVDRAFDTAESILSLGERRAYALQHLAAEIAEQRIRFAVLPETPATPAQRKLCELLGARISQVHSVLLCRFGASPLLSGRR